MCFAGSPCQNFTLADEPVPFSLSTKDLGLHVTADLKWNVHIQETTCKAFSALCFLKRNTVEGLKLVKSMVLPILLYGSTVWYASKTNLRKLQQTQWKAVKWVLANGEPNYNVALKKLNLLPLSLYLELNDILLLSNIISNKIDFDWQPFLKPSQRRNQLFDLMPILNDVQRQNFWYRSAKLANLLHPITNLSQPEGLKARLLYQYWKYFEDTYNPPGPLYLAQTMSLSNMSSN